MNARDERAPMNGLAPVCVACALPIHFADPWAPYCTVECAEAAALEVAEARRAAFAEEMCGRELALQERDGLWRGDAR